ncbi:MAG: hypothetical protein HY907_10935 [Deltaproteobacteria bacterium]|nr:hypothetical protein [Deltaproteobacteria bacterium]
MPFIAPPAARPRPYGHNRTPALIIAGCRLPVACCLFTLLPAAACSRPTGGRFCGDVRSDDGRPVQGARLTAHGARTTSDRFGRFCLDDVPAGADVRAEADDTCGGSARAEPGQWLRIVVSKSLVVDSLHQVGFGTDVELRASLRCPPPGPVSWRWEQLEGPPAEPPGAAATPAAGPAPAGPAFRFRTARLAARTSRPDVLALAPPQAGRYLFRVTALGGDRVLRAEAEVTAASLASGLLSVPVDTYAYVDSGAGRPPGSWRVAKRPEGSNAHAEAVPTADGGAGVARARFDRVGLYELVDDRGGTRLLFEAGPWDTVPQDCDRPECHPREELLWQTTPHARALDDRLDGPTPEPFGPRCLPCHVVGWDPGAAAAGFDDVATETDTFVGDDWPGGAATLPRDLRRLANVWCIACHGSGRLPEHGKRPMVVRAGVCAQCHDAPPRYTRVAEWRLSRMSHPVADPALLAEPCAGCHTAQGAVSRMRGRLARPVDAALAEPVTCAVCHVAHTEDQELLRQRGTAAATSGVLFEAGRAAVCLGCHQAGERTGDEASRARRLPEAPQTEVLFGTGAYGAAGRPHHLSPDLCVDCHMARCADCHTDAERHRGGHTFRAMPPADAAPEDCDGDGRTAAIPVEVEACLALARARVESALSSLPGCTGAVLARAGQSLAPRDPAGRTLPDCETEWRKPEHDALYRAAHDLLLIERDGSKGAHNPAFAVRVLRAVLKAWP